MTRGERSVLAGAATPRPCQAGQVSALPASPAADQGAVPASPARSPRRIRRLGVKLAGISPWHFPQSVVGCPHSSSVPSSRNLGRLVHSIAQSPFARSSTCCSDPLAAPEGIGSQDYPGCCFRRQRVGLIGKNRNRANHPAGGGFAASRPLVGRETAPLKYRLGIRRIPPGVPLRPSRPR